MLILILGALTLYNISRYKKTGLFTYAKSANTMATINLIFSTISLMVIGIFALALFFMMTEEREFLDTFYEEDIAIAISTVIFFAIPITETVFGFVTAAKGRSLYKNLNSGTYKQSVTNYQYNYNRYSTADSSNSFLNASGEDIRANSTVAQQTYSRADEIQGIPSDAINVQTLSEEAVKRLRKWKCPNCKKTNSMDETFCKNCGTNQSVFY